MTDAYLPTVSIIINTDGRAKSLRNCLESLKYLRYGNFEIVIVAGPTKDGTRELCETYGDKIIFSECPERNLSMSRNLAIQLSSGELVGFLDDDSIPEAEWLNDVVPSFRDPDVAVAGGFLHDHTGKTFQWTFGTLNRYGAADNTWKRSTPEFNFPNSFNYPHVMANSVFRRSAIVEIGGFDEEFEYFLDESDLIVRMVDAGWTVAQLNRGFVHHKSLASHIRNDSRVLTSWYSVFKNKTYFSLINGGGHTTMEDVLSAVQSSVRDFDSHVRWAIKEQLLEPSALGRFKEEVDRALRDGLARGLSGERRLVRPQTLEGRNSFRRFPPLLTASEQRCYVFLSKTYPPGRLGGIGRYVHQLAKEIARIGHQVHVLTSGEDFDRVDFEDGVWVHRVCEKTNPAPAGLEVPEHLWNYSNSVYEEAMAIGARRPIDAVCAPIWDVEGIAFLVRKGFRLVTSLHTPLAAYLDTNIDKLHDRNFVSKFANPVLKLERRLFLESDGIVANSNAILEEIERKYALEFDQTKVSIVPHGLEDWTTLSAELPERANSKGPRICFVGRLEMRKGADVFLRIVPELLEKYPEVIIDIVGNDKISEPGHVSLRRQFEIGNQRYAAHRHLTFHGEVSEERLRGFYQAADIIVAPSRFESFGLVHLEGMMFGKPVVGCDAGGMREVIEHGITGLLAQPANTDSLMACIAALIADDQFRTKLGENARDAFLTRFGGRRMAQRTIDVLCAFSAEECV